MQLWIENGQRDADADLDGLGRPAERGEEHAREYADDGDHHQQFDQGETMIRALGYWKTHTFSWALLRTPSLPGSRCE